MESRPNSQTAQDAAEARVDHFRQALGPFVIAAEGTRMPMIFTDAKIDRHPVVFANESFLSLTGFGRSEILGKGISFLLKEVTDPSLRSAVETALDGGINGTWEAQCRRANGKEYLATIFLSPVIDHAGEILQHFLCFVEVSGRVDRLLAQRGEFNALYEQAPSFVAALEGREHRFTFANASYRRLVGREQLVGHRLCDVVPEAVTQGFVALLDRVFETGEPFLGDAIPMWISREAGPESSIHYLNLVYQPVRDADGVITGVFVEGYDVTAERLALERLSLLQGEVAHASRVNAMGMMAATLAHELNQPLTAISNYVAGCVRMLDPSSPNSGAVADALREIENAAQRAGHVIRNVRELTKRGETPKTEFNLKNAIEECAKLVRAGACPTAIIEDRTPDALIVVADRLQLQQVVINLLRNACDATNDAGHGRVTIDTALDGTEIVVSVTDTGHGLSSEAAQNIFQWTDSSKGGGAGLGLSISRTMIEAQNGRIWLQKSDSCGSQFCFSLPATRLG